MVRGFGRVDSLDTSKEVCFVWTNTRESGSDSVDMYVRCPKSSVLGIFVGPGLVLLPLRLKIVDGSSFAFVIKNHMSLIISNGPNVIQFLLVCNPCYKLQRSLLHPVLLNSSLQ